MHYLHLLPTAAVAGVSLPGSNGFKRRHGAELTSEGRGVALLCHIRRRKKNPQKLSPLERYSSVWKYRRAVCLYQLCAQEESCSGRDAARRGQAV